VNRSSIPVGEHPAAPPIRRGRRVAARLGTTATVVLVLLVAGTPGGCSEKSSPRKHRQLEGTIEHIDRADALVTLRFYSPKREAETTVTGKVTAETEIFVNGALSSLEDLREGERVTVLGWVRGHGSQREVVAVKVTVERAETIRRQPSEPSSTDNEGAEASPETMPADTSTSSPGEAG
jgi:hypothetical protein